MIGNGRSRSVPRAGHYDTVRTRSDIIGLAVHAGIALAASAALALAATGFLIWGVMLARATPEHLHDRWPIAIILMAVGVWTWYATGREVRRGEMTVHGQIVYADMHPVLYRMILAGRFAIVAFCLAATLCILMWPQA